MLSAARAATFSSIWLAFYLLAVVSPQLRVLKGNSDFLAQYTAGQLLLQGQGEHLYDIKAQKQVQAKVLASLNSDVQFAEGLLLFTHPPFVALSYAPVARLPFVTGFLIWNVISLICFVAGIAQLVRYYRLHEQPDFEVLTFLCLLYLPVSATLLQGQNTAMAFLFLVLSFLNFKRGSELTAGLWLSLVLVKFQLLPVMLLILLLKRRWQALLGFCAGGLVLALISLGIVGWEGLWRYLKLLSEMPEWVNRYGLNPLGAHSIRGQMFLLFHNTLPRIIPSMTILLNVVLVIALFRCWKGEWNTQNEFFDVKFALLIILGLLVAPHVNFHDLAFLLLPGLVVFHHTAKEGVLMDSCLRSTLFVVGFPLQVLSFIALPIVPIQFNVIGLIALTAVLVHTIRSRGPGRFVKLH